MNHEPLPLQHYYRPSQARALRRRAERLEWWAGPGTAAAIATVPALLGAVVFRALRIDGWEAWVVAVQTLAVVLLAACVPLVCLYHDCAELLRERAARLHEEAAALEAEHAARHRRGEADAEWE
jgi:hypothetical protein